MLPAEYRLFKVFINTPYRQFIIKIKIFQDSGNMNQLFTEDNMRSESFLRTVRRYLKLTSLLELEEVSPVSREAVQEYHYPVRVCLADNNRREIRKDDDRNLCGPIISNLHIQYGHLRKYTQDWDWLLSTLIKHAPHVKKLSIEFLNLSIDDEVYDKLNRRADIALGHVTFPNCTTLRIFGGPVDSPHRGYHRVMRNFLRSFPAVECLTISGARIPLLSELPAPEKLRHLEVRTYPSEDAVYFDTQAAGVEPITANFANLESLAIFDRDMCDPFSFYYRNNVTLDTEGRHVMTIMTGIRWLTSFTEHPPARLTDLRLNNLSSWGFPLLTICANLPQESPQQDFRLALNIDVIGSKELLRRIATQPLRNLTHLRFSQLTSETDYLLLLALTPSLQELQINIDPDFKYDPDRLVKHPLPCLTRLVVCDLQNNLDCCYPVRAAWFESFRRNASPAGLEIIDTDKKRIWLSELTW